MTIGTLLPIDAEDREPFLDNTYELGGIELLVRLEYSERLNTYYMTLFDADGDTIYANRKILAGYQVAIRQRDARLPPGIFVPADTDLRDTPPTFDELGGRVKLLFVPNEDIPPLDPLTDAVKIVVV